MRTCEDITSFLLLARIWHPARHMPLTVYSCVTYSTAFGGVRTQDHWTALHFVNAIKRTPLAGYAYLPLPSTDPVRVDRSSADAAPTWFAKLAVRALPWPDVPPCVVVPIPDAACDLNAARPPDAFVLAEALASELGPDAVAVDLLRWVRPMAKAHSGDGTRDTQVLYGRLRLRERTWPIGGHRVLLLDDVIATGAHLRAAAAFLTDSGAQVIGAIGAAHAVDCASLDTNALAPSSLVLPDFSSDPDWLLPEIYDGIEL